MKYRATFIAGAALGYVLGTRAGRERYEQIKRMSRQVAENPTIQEAAGVLRARTSDLACTARQKAGDRFHIRLPGQRAEPEADDPYRRSGIDATAP